MTQGAEVAGAGGTRIERVELRRLHMPLVAPFRTSFGTSTARDVLLVRIDTATATGWGECVADAEPTYSSEYADGAQHVIARHLVPRLAAAGRLTAARVGPLLEAVKGHPMAKAALEAAVLDAELRTAGVSFADHLGAVADRVPAGVSVGIHPSVPALLDAVGGYLDEGYLRIKLKIEPGWDVEPVRAVRERFGDDVLLQVDANTAYRLADARHLARLDDFGLLLIEQPLPEDDVRGHAALARQLRTPVCLDESIVSARSAADAIALGACSIVNIKAGRVGGYLEARRVHDVCAANGVPRVVRRHARDRASGAPPTSPSPRCPGSCCPATRRPRAGTTRATSPSRSSSTAGTWPCRPAPGWAGSRCPTRSPSSPRRWRR